MNQGFQVDVEELRRTADKILRTLEGAERNDLDSIAKNTQKYGHDGIARAVSEFCDGAKMAIPAMASNSRSLGTSLAQSADHYRDLDAHVAHLIDPSLSS